MNIIDLKVAKTIASETTAKYIAENGENPFGCGFAWVDVKGIRGKKLELLKRSMWVLVLVFGIHLVILLKTWMQSMLVLLLSQKH